MQATIFTQVILPAVLALIMFGMGLSLVKSDFTRLFKTPKPIVSGLVGQLICLPLLALMLAYICIELFEMPPYVAVGLMIIAACPGGTTSNLISHIARANLALSVSLTAITTVVCVVTTPFIIKYSIALFDDAHTQDFSLLKTSLSLLLISIVPIALGMLVRHKFSKFARREEPKFRALSVIFMLLLIAVISYQERDMMATAFPDIYLSSFALNIVATLLGLFIAKIAQLSLKDAVTLGIEIGTQNATLAILIAVSFVQVPEYAIAGGVYGVTMYLGAFALVMFKRKALKNA